MVNVQVNRPWFQIDTWKRFLFIFVLIMISSFLFGVVGDGMGGGGVVTWSVHITLAKIIILSGPWQWPNLGVV